MGASRTTGEGALAPSDEARNWRLAGAIFLFALAVRSVGLGGSSMWLDEIMETLMARGSLAELYSDLLFDRAQPPVEPTFAWALLALGAGEWARRAIQAAIGAAAVALFARWIARRFDRPTAVLAGLFCAVSPVLLRYAHELRPYALSLLLSVWALDAADRWADLSHRRFPWELTCAAGLAALTHYLAVAIWLPIAAAWLESRAAGKEASPLRYLAISGATSLLPLACWFSWLAVYGGPDQSFRTADWSWSLVERRFEDLTLRGFPGQGLPKGAPLLIALLAVLGLAVLARRRGGLTILAGLVGGTAVVEAALLAMGRFSHLRYNLLAVLFLLTAVAAAIVASARWFAALDRRSAAAMATLLTAAVVASMASGVVGYAQFGRPDWRAVARAIATLEGDEARVITTNSWTQISIGYYLGRSTRLRETPRGVPTVFGDRGQLESELRRSAARCALVLDAGPASPERLFAGLRPKRPVLSLPRTDRSRLFQFAVGATPRQDCFPPPDFAVQMTKGYGELFPWAISKGVSPV